MKLKKRFASLFLLALMAFIPVQAYASGSVPTTPSGIPISEIENRTDQIMKKYIGTAIPGAAVSIVKDGKIVFSKGYGYSNIEKQTPMSTETTYMEAGSVSKLFTWTAVMQLVEQEKLDLNTDIRTYLPDGFLKLSFDKPITLKSLMSHTAGFEEHLEKLLVHDPADLRSLKEHIAPRNQPEQIYEPGTVIAYSNYGTNLAGYIIERVSGMPFETYIQKHIFEPLDMKHSYFTQRYDLIPEVIEHKATGYSKKDGNWVAKPNVFFNDVPAGALNITSEDMAHFMLAHLNMDHSLKYSLFNKNETLREMHEASYTHYPELPGNAHGFWERFAGDYRVIEHGGNTDSFSSLVSIVPDQNFGISILTNVENEMSGARSELIDLFVGGSDATPQADSTLKHSGDVAGKYRSARAVSSGILKLIPVLSNAEEVVTANGHGGITLSIPSMNIHVDYVETKPYFFERVTPGSTPYDYAGLNISRLFFLTNADGKVTQLSYGVIDDQLPISFLQTSIFSYILVGACGIWFALGFVFGITGWLRKLKDARKQKSTSRLPFPDSVTVIPLLGLLVIVNLIASSIQLIGDPFQPMSNFNLNIIFFWVLGLAFVPAAYLAVRRCNVTKTTLLRKVYTATLILSFLAISIFLYSYNFYFLA
ncbi:serine hydrolase domain-containing protein [Paenibacillus polymyxa]|uniref:serine hydrolase domain-containing protein n=1 Tax=Paenibacillus polymyxa TaxID=1406 RepID=UPI002AB446DE|nr:serine hydrolase domain-containing protein [Paenibacillus polymyxa]MDY8021693.1 serine hydrolase domain-containing protein [Paenibacillus polymyxa]